MSIELNQPSEKYQTLLAMHATHRQELSFHRQVMSTSLQWVSTIYLAIAGGIIAIGLEDWQKFGGKGSAFITVVVAAIAYFSVQQHRHSASAIDSNAGMIVKIDDLLGLFASNFFKAGDSIYPSKWRQWGTGKGAGYYEYQNIAIIIVESIALTVFVWAI